MPRGQWVFCGSPNVGLGLDVGFQWTKERIISLIEQYYHCPELWDKSHSNYKEAGVCHMAWKEVGRDMLVDVGVNPGVLETQHKIKYLVSQFQKEWRKVKSGKVAEAEIKWPYYHHLKFLKDANITTKTKSTKNNNLSKETSLNKTKTTSSKSKNTSTTIPKENSSLNLNLNKEETLIDDEPNVSVTPSASKSPQKKRKYNQENESSATMNDAPPNFTLNSSQSKAVINKIEKSASNCASDLPQPKRKNSQMEEFSTTKDDFCTDANRTKDEFDAFGEHVAWQIRKLADKKEQALAIHKINTILFEIEMPQAQKD